MVKTSRWSIDGSQVSMASSVQEECEALIVQSQELQERCATLSQQLRVDAETRRVMYKQNTVVRENAAAIIKLIIPRERF